MKTVCIGSAVMDITAKPVSQKGSWQEKQRIEDIRIQTGGDAANQSVHLAALGWEPGLISCVGKDTNGRMLRAALENRGVDTSLMQEMEKYPTGTAMVLVDEQGERHTFSVKGAHSMLDREALPESLPPECRAISLASLFSMPLLEEKGLLEFLQREKERGVLVFADLAADKMKKGLNGIRPFLPLIDYFLPSLYDVLEMTGRGTAEEAAETFLALGAGNVVIKCGAEGCFCAGPSFTGRIPAHRVEPVDTTGAGDCMSAVFLARVLAGDGMEEACQYACQAASYSTLFLGASSVELSDEKIRAFAGARWDA